MNISEVTATIRLDTSEIDSAIEKANQLLALLREVQKTASPLSDDSLNC